MTRLLLVGGSAAALVGVALLLPAYFARLEDGSITQIALGVVFLGGALIVCGVAALVAGACRWRGLSLPSAVRAAVAGNILFLAFFALEISDGLVRRGGRIHPLSAGLFLPTLFVLYGILTARRWAWWVSRGVAATFIVWFFGSVPVIPFLDLRSEGVPIPWYGRVYVVCVSLVLGGILAGGFWSLGRPEARSYFGLLRPEKSVDA